MKTLKELIKGEVHFQFYRKGELFYKTDSGFEFRVPCEDCGDASFLAKDRAMLFMRYIRKELKEIESKTTSGISLEKEQA